MQRLTGLDATFLYLETPALVMHTLLVLVLERPPGSNDLVFEQVRRGLAQRLHLLPPTRRRLLEVPLALYHPVLVEDPDFQLDAHLRRVRVAAPGTSVQRDATIAELSTVPLDRSRPLWELCVLEGLHDGSLTLVCKLHHAIADGVGIAHLLTNVLSKEPAEMDLPEAAPPWRPEPTPSPRALVAHALRERLEGLARLPELFVRTARNAIALAQRRRAATVPLPKPMLDTPHTSYHGALTQKRAFATAALPFLELEEVKGAFHVTLNSVLLAVVAGALRSALQEHGALPSRPLIAAVPMGLDQGGEARFGGNNVSNLLTSLATDVADPVERLRAIDAVTAQAKQVHEVLGTGLLQQWSQHASPRIFRWAVRQWSRPGFVARVPAPINLIVSNVRGAAGPLYAARSKLRELYFVGPLLEGAGLNVTVWSYLGVLHVSVLGSADRKPTPQHIALNMHAALAELVRCAETLRESARSATESSERASVSAEGRA